MPLSDEGIPPAAFDRKQVPGFPARQLIRKGNRGFPVPWKFRNREGRGGIDHINPDLGLFGLRQPHCFQQRWRQRTTRRSIDDEIGGKRPDRAIANTAPDRTYPAIIVRHQIKHPAAVEQYDILILLSPEALSHDMLEQWPRHGVSDPAEVAPRERIVTRKLHPGLGSDPDR